MLRLLLCAVSIAWHCRLLLTLQVNTSPLATVPVVKLAAFVPVGSPFCFQAYWGLPALVTVAVRVIFWPTQILSGLALILIVGGPRFGFTVAFKLLALVQPLRLATIW